VTLVWIGLALIVLFFAWAGWKLRGRDQYSGPEATGDRHRRTGGYEQGNG
jgi:hypothetical protein